MDGDEWKASMISEEISMRSNVSGRDAGGAPEHYDTYEHLGGAGCPSSAFVFPFWVYAVEIERMCLQAYSRLMTLMHLWHVWNN